MLPDGVNNFSDFCLALIWAVAAYSFWKLVLFPPMNGNVHTGRGKSVSDKVKARFTKGA